MTKRRKVLLGLGTSVAVAGCSGTSQSNEGETEQQESEPAEAEIFITNVQPKRTSFGAKEEFEISVTYQNRGEESGEFEVQSEFDGEKSEPQTLQLDAGESETITIDVDANEYEAGNYEYTFFGGDKQESGSFTIEEPEAEPASFQVNDYYMPNKVQIGEEYVFRLDIENTGEVDGTYTTDWHLKFSDTDWKYVGTLEIEVEAGEEKLYQSEMLTGREYLGEMSYRFDKPNIKETIDFVPRIIKSGNSYTSPNGIKITDKSHEREEEKWIFHNISVTNNSGELKYLPTTEDFFLVSGDNQYSPSFGFNAPRDSGQYEGGETVDGVTREGWVAFEVDEEYSFTDYAFTWAGSDSTGSWIVKFVGPGYE